MELLINEASKNIKYKDLWVRILAPLPFAHFVLAINKPETFLQIVRLPGYFQDLFWSSLIAFIVIQIIYWVTTYLDKESPWFKDTGNRVIEQIVLGIIMPSSIAYSLSSWFFYFKGTSISETTFMSLEFWFCILFIVLFNSYYVIYHFARLFLLVNDRKKVLSAEGMVNDNSKEWLLQYGSEWAKIKESDIAYFIPAVKGALAVTFDDQRYISNKNLEGILQEVDKKRFFLVGRSHIVNRDAIKGYKGASSRRIQIFLKMDIKEELHISQPRAKEFRDWWKKGI